jgi:UDPglucose--hexose-1-phosphate uridylyltransferase
MKLSDQQNISHQRFNPLTRDWVLVSPHRMERPWLGKVEESPPAQAPSYDSECYLCPGNARAAGARNPKYESTFVFENDFPALQPEAPQTEGEASGLLVARAEGGVCRVVCFSPRHDLTIPRMSSRELRRVVDVWVEQYESLGKIPWIQHVQIFENRGTLTGCSNPHPHCQIWANSCIPNEPAKEQASFREYNETHNACLICEYTKQELGLRERIVCENDAFVALVPYWAIWPFETLLLSKRHTTGMDELTLAERDLLADILKWLTIRYDNLFRVPFPYTMGFHQRPTDGRAHPEWHFHAHYYPPLLRSATVQKFMVGYELLATPQRDITPESAAARLFAMKEIHYLDENVSGSGP